MVVVRAKRTIAFSALVLFLSGTFTLFAQAPAGGKLSILAFGDYFYNVGRDSAIGKIANAALGGAKDQQGFQFRRIYFTYDQNISASFTSRFRLEADQDAVATNGKISVFVKDAYLKWKDIFGGSDLIFGIQPTPTFDVSESVWGYRSLEKTIMDLRGIAPSRDIALSLKGRFDDEGKFGYWVMIGNGSGNRPETDKYKRYYGQLQWKPVEGLVVTAYGDLRAAPPVFDSSSASKVSNDATTLALFVAYKKDKDINAGVEVFSQSVSNAIIETPTPFKLRSRSIMGATVYGNYFFTPKLAVVARFDYFDPDNNSAAPGDTRNLIVAGLDWRPEDNVSIMPNIEMESYAVPDGARSLDPSLTARVTFAYSFQ